MSTLPRFVVVKSRHNNKYLCYMDEDNNNQVPAGYLKCYGEDAASQYAKFEVEKAKSTTKMVHIKCCYNNKYWVRLNTSSYLIAAAADEPNEKESNALCTLFEPIYISGQLNDEAKSINSIALRFLHIQRKEYLQFYGETSKTPQSGGLYVGDTAPRSDLLDVYYVIDWESLFMKLPKHVAFKDRNGNYLSVRLIDGHPHLLQFESTLIGDPTVVNEIFTNPEGSLRLKSNSSGKFWRLTEDDWICADSDDSTSNDSCTLFWAIKVSDNVVALRNSRNNKYCVRFTVTDKIIGGLSANVTTIDQEAYLEVEEILNPESLVIKLPKYVAFKGSDGNYLSACLMDGHPYLLLFKSTVIGDPTVVNEVFTNTNGSLRIKSNSSGKFWRLTKDDWICADSDDSTSNDSYTLFWPIKIRNNVVALRNLRNNKFCMRFTPTDKIIGGLNANVTTIDEKAYLEVEEIPNPEVLVMKLPKHVAFKDRNGNYLSACLIDGHPHMLQFESTVIEDPTVVNEVFTNADGSLRIRSNSSGKFWRLTDDDWICADFDDSTSNDSHTLFWPVKHSDNVLTLCNKHNNKFCTRFTATDKITGGLSANTTTINGEAYLEVEEIPNPKSMVLKLPKHVAFKGCNGDYLGTHMINMHPHLLMFKSTDIGDPTVGNELLTNVDGSLRIKSNSSGKFWRLTKDDWICADSDDTTSNDSNTLFWPVKLGDNIIALRNIGSNKFCNRFTVTDKVTSSLSNNVTMIEKEAYLEVEEIPNPKSPIIKIPKHVAFKDRNGNYLGTFMIDRNPHLLQFKSTEIGDPIVGHEVFTNADGTLRIKSVFSGKFWRLTNNDWICADSDGYTSKDSHTLFWPVKLGDNIIALRNIYNNKFCTRFTITDKITSSLSANITTIDKEACLEVEEIFPLIRDISNVTLRLWNARIYNQTVVEMAIGEVVNRTKESCPVKVKLSYTETRSSCWKYSSISPILKLCTAKSNAYASVPVISADRKVKIGLTGALVQFGETVTASNVKEAVYKVVLPAMTKVKVMLLATEASCDVPFSYTQRDTLTSGEIITKNVDDGMYTGVNTFDFKFGTTEEKL